MSYKRFDAAFPAYDARDGLGYGVLKPTGFNSPRSFIQYSEVEEGDPEIVDDESYEMILQKIIDYMPSDPYAVNKTDPFYFVGGNTTKLAELSTATGMVPFPRMYAKRTKSGFGGSGKALPHPGPTANFRSRIRPTGTKKGFSQPPYPQAEFEDVLGPEYILKDIMADDEDEKSLLRIKELIKMIHQEQNAEK